MEEKKDQEGVGESTPHDPVFGAATRRNTSNPRISQSRGLVYFFVFF